MRAMRILVALALVMVTGCSDGADTISVDDACADQAEAWCSIVDQCDAWIWPNCVQERTDSCLVDMSAPVERADNNACLDILWATELDTSTCEIESGDWWPDECACTRDGSCK